MPTWVQSTLGAIVAGVVVSAAITIGNVVADDRVQDRRLDDAQIDITILQSDVAKLKSDSAVAVEILKRIEKRIISKE